MQRLADGRWLMLFKSLNLGENVIASAAGGIALLEDIRCSEFVGMLSLCPEG